MHQGTLFGVYCNLLLNMEPFAEHGSFGEITETKFWMAEISEKRSPHPEEASVSGLIESLIAVFLDIVI